jgi:hypothetical protein
VILWCDLAHHKAIGCGCVVGGGPGERRWRGRGGTPTGAWLPARFGAGKFNTQPWELEGVLEKG